MQTSLVFDAGVARVIVLVVLRVTRVCNDIIHNRINGFISETKDQHHYQKKIFENI